MFFAFASQEQTKSSLITARFLFLGLTQALALLVLASASIASLACLLWRQEDLAKSGTGGPGGHTGSAIDFLRRGLSGRVAPWLCPGSAPVSTPSLCLPIPCTPQPLLQAGGVCPCPHPATGLLPSLSSSQIPPQSHLHSLPFCAQPDHLPDIIPPPPASGGGGHACAQWLWGLDTTFLCSLFPIRAGEFLVPLEDPFRVKKLGNMSLILWPFPFESESCSVMSSFCNPMDYTVHGILQARILE